MLDIFDSHLVWKRSNYKRRHLLYVLLVIVFIGDEVQKDRKSVIGEQDGGEGKRGGGWGRGKGRGDLS